MRSPLGVILGVCLLGYAAPACDALDEDPEKDVVVTIQDPTILESSGLIARDGDFLTVNDSGDEGRIFVVDGKSGETIGVTFWSATPQDVEAIAPATGDDIWVGDIGDNREQRPWIEVTRLPVRAGDRTQAGQTFRLAYPGGPVNAEALLADPVTGRLYVATKVPQADGRLYEAPETLDPIKVNILKPIAKVASLVTDGAFFPDGKHLILRGYGGARVYSFPDMTPVGDVVDLPEQPQGEGIAVSADGEIFLSSEGENQPVLRVELPASVRGDMGLTSTPSGSPGSTPASPSEPGGSADAESPDLGDPGDSGDAGDSGDSGDFAMLPWLAAGVVGVGVLFSAGWYLRRRSR